ncbi:MAG TPA: hypothetical protein VJ305_15790 [Streptosporangiaceae bacterium]|nr:hypothetical protein [Streptosporangiaceae bacterium]
MLCATVAWNGYSSGRRASPASDADNYACCAQETKDASGHVSRHDLARVLIDAAERPDYLHQAIVVGP